MLEVRWTFLERKKEVGKYVLLVSGRDQVSLEVVGKANVVWNGKEGIRMDHAKKEFVRYSKRPEFGEASLFEIPGVLNGEGSPLTYLLSQSSIESSGRTYDVVKVTNHQIDAIAKYVYYFDPKSKLLVSINVEFRGMWEGGETEHVYRIEKFDTYAMIDKVTFAMEPPRGYIEKRTGGTGRVPIRVE